MKNTIKTNKEIFSYLMRKLNFLLISLSLISAFVWQINLKDEKDLIGGWDVSVMLFFIYTMIFFTLMLLLSSSAYLNLLLVIRNNLIFRFLSFYGTSVIGSIAVLSLNKYNNISIAIVFLCIMVYSLFYLKFNKFLK
jgi:hypothetical protein